MNKYVFKEDFVTEIDICIYRREKLISYIDFIKENFFKIDIFQKKYDRLSMKLIILYLIFV